jgi:hypothetical protein
VSDLDVSFTTIGCGPAAWSPETASSGGGPALPFQNRVILQAATAAKLSGPIFRLNAFPLLCSDYVGAQKEQSKGRKKAM